MRKITGFRRIAVRGRSWTDRSGRLWQIRYPFPEPSLVSLGKVHHLFHGLMVARAMQALSPRAGPSTNRPVSHQHTQWLCLCFWKRGRLPSASLWMPLVKAMFASIHTFLQSLPCDQQGTHSSDKPLMHPGDQQRLLPPIAGSPRGGFPLGWGAEPLFLASSNSFLWPNLPDANKLFLWDSR